MERRTELPRPLQPALYLDDFNGLDASNEYEKLERFDIVANGNHIGGERLIFSAPS